MNFAETVGSLLASRGVRTAFGVVGSGNFHVTNALIAHGVRFVAARHEGGAVTMADAYARMSDEVGVVTVHQGPGLTNAMTGLTEAAKSRTPLLVIAAEATTRTSNFWIDQAALAEAVGARTYRAGTAAEVSAAFEAARRGATVLLNLPLDAQAASQSLDMDAVEGAIDVSMGVQAAREAVAGHQGGPAAGVDLTALGRFAGLLSSAARPVFIAGRGARGARLELEALAVRSGALLATSAVARGLFRGNPFDLDVSGGFATPLTAALIGDADLVVGWGCALNMWTTRHGRLISPGATVVQVDRDPAAIGAHRPVTLGVTGDVATVAGELLDVVTPSPGYRSDALAARVAAEGRWNTVPYEDEGGGGLIDPRTLSIGLDDLLPAERIVAVDSGNFMGYPAMYLDVPDEYGFCFTQAFQSVGLGLATAIGAALARPDRLPVCALGDGGALMGISELETAVRLGLPMVIVVYDDEAYGAEVHHFGPSGHPLDTVRFPPVDFAAIARGFGCEAVTVRDRADLAGVGPWLAGPRTRPLVVHARVAAGHGSWWLEEAFRGH